VVAVAKQRVNEKVQKESKLSDAPLDQAKFDKDVFAETYKLFAEVEKRRVQLEERDTQERKRKRENELDLEKRRKDIKEKEEKWETGREERVSSWRNFATGKKTTKKATGELKPPKLKQQR